MAADRTAGPSWVRASSSSPDDRKVSTVVGSVTPVMSRYADVYPSWATRTWAKVLFRTRHLTPVQASSS